MSKTYRVFIDVKAESKEDAIDKADALIANTSFRVQEDPFSDEEEGTILELARVAITDAEVYDYMAGQLDLSDEYLKELQKKIEAITNRP